MRLFPNLGLVDRPRVRIAMVSSLLPVMLLSQALLSQPASAQQYSSVQYPAQVASGPVVVSPSGTTMTTGVVCPKCGRIHATSGNSGVTNPVIPTSYSTPSSYPTQPGYSQPGNPTPTARVSGGGVRNVLGMLNGQRSRQGLSSLRYDGALQAVAEQRAQKMASMGIKSHPPGSFAPGRYEGVGWSSSFSPSGVYACYTSDPNMTVAGAAMVRGRDGVYFAVVYR